MNKRFKPKFNIRKGDNVVVIAGDDKDRTQPRKVLSVSPTKGRVLIEGVNLVTKHLKPNAQNPAGRHCKGRSAYQHLQCDAVGRKVQSSGTY